MFCRDQKWSSSDKSTLKFHLIQPKKKPVASYAWLRNTFPDLVHHLNICALLRCWVSIIPLLYILTCEIKVFKRLNVDFYDDFAFISSIALLFFILFISNDAQHLTWTNMAAWMTIDINRITHILKLHKPIKMFIECC